MERSDVFAIIRYRRSVREYDPRPIEDWKLDLILESARLAPSSTNSQPWRIIVVKDAALKTTLSDATPASINRHPWFEKAPVILVLCTVKSGTQKFAQFLGKNYQLVDMGIVGEHIVLTAAELGLGTCWVGWVHKSHIKKVLSIPTNWEVACIIPVGYPKGESIPREKVYEKFSTVAPRQLEGEAGIGNTPANKRRSIDEIIFHEKVKK
nr:nitroreductase family protein [Candidatus Sigynarchaeota archaeon]